MKKIKSRSNKPGKKLRPGNEIGQIRKPFAKKSLGQNFLVDGNYIEKIISALELKPGDVVVEIGPGRGALTRRLLEKAGRVFAVELDRDLIPVLNDEFREFDNFELIEADALKADFAEILEPENRLAKLVANLPYYISTAILQRLIEQRDCFSGLVLMLQREVVERITALAGSSERGYLTVMVEAFCRTEKLFDVPPTAFRPVPKVWSSVVKVIPQENAFTQQDEKLLKQLVSAGFARKRKTIFNNLKNVEPELQALIEKRGGAKSLLDSAEIDFERRAETITSDEWFRLVKKLSGYSVG